MNVDLNESNFADLSAWSDGEVAPERSAEIERLVREDRAWTDALSELKAVDSALEAWTGPACLEGLAERIIGGVRTGQRPGRKAAHLLRWLVPAASAAAAAILLAVILHSPDVTPPPRAPAEETVAVREILKDIPNGDKFIVENLEFFQNYELCSVMEENAVLLDEATLDALDDLEAGGI